MDRNLNQVYNKLNLSLIWKIFLASQISDPDHSAFFPRRDRAGWLAERLRHFPFSWAKSHIWGLKNRLALRDSQIIFATDRSHFQLNRPAAKLWMRATNLKNSLKKWTDIKNIRIKKDDNNNHTFLNNQLWQKIAFYSYLLEIIPCTEAHDIEQKTCVTTDTSVRSTLNGYVWWIDGMETIFKTRIARWQ